MQTDEDRTVKAQRELLENVCFLNYMTPAQLAVVEIPWLAAALKRIRPDLVVDSTRMRGAVEAFAGVVPEPIAKTPVVIGGRKAAK